MMMPPKNAVILSALALSCGSAFGIDTVDELVVSKYLGRWYQLYGNEFTAMTITRDSTCIAADYGLDEATGNITVINSDREHVPTGELNTITGYAYGTCEENPGRLKVHLGQVPVDGDYWIVGLGPESYGPDEAYEWAIVSGPSAQSLFILVRDVERFDEMFAEDVLEFVDSLGFTQPMTKPQRIVQEGCLPFDPTTVSYEARTKKSNLRQERGREATRISAGKHGSRAVRERDISDLIVDALVLKDQDRAKRQETEHSRVKMWTREPEPGRLSVAEVLDELDVLMTASFVDAADSPFTPAAGQSEIYGASQNEVVSSVQRINRAPQRLSADVVGEPLRPMLPPVTTVTTLDVDRYVGRWYQAYGSYTVGTLLEKNGACVTADYSVNDDGSIAVTNTARAKGVDGSLIQMDGYAYTVDESEPGQLMVHLDGVPLDAPYYVLALGDEDGSEPYPWAIVSDPLRAFLFVLVRDPTSFSGSDQETELLKLCEDLGFTAFWNYPRKTIQEGCTYTATMDGGFEALIEPEVVGRVEVEEKSVLEKVLAPLQGPLHASCKLSWSFPSDDCETVGGAFVDAAKSMSGFDKCNGGNKCGYSVTDTSSGQKLKMVHETSVKHYKDDLTIDLEGKDGSCTAKGFSTSQIWIAILDNSVNYCNLHNLVDATGLDYEETGVSDQTCTQYSSANCERY